MIKETFVLRAFKYRLYPNQHQQEVMTSWFDQCRQIYNAALEQRVTAYKQHRRSLSYMEQQKDLTDLRASDKVWENVSVHAQRSALHRLDRAFTGFFNRCKRGEKQVGFPRFRSRHQYSSFTLHRGAWAPKREIISGKRMHVPKIGHVRLDLYRPIQGEIRDVSIWCDGAKRWWVSFQCEVGTVPEKRAVRSMVGIDLGIKSLAVLSTGEEIANPRYGEAGQKALARRQRCFDRKVTGSKSRERASIIVAKAYAHVTNQRREHAREVAKKLFSRYDLIAHEDVKGRVLSDLHQGRFSKSFRDVSWGGFLRALELKAESAGAWLVPVDPRNTSQLCSSCGAFVEKTLAQRTHRCVKCGLVIDRDHNAALNVLTRGSRVLELAQAGVEGKVSTTVSSKRQGRAGAPRCPKDTFKNPEKQKEIK